MEFPSPTTYRPAITGSNYMVATGHYLASAAALQILERGGNAIDAGVAAGMCINMLQPDMTNLGGVAPVMLFNVREGRVVALSGLGSWPRATRREYFSEECAGKIPPGVHRCVMPAAIDSWLTALERWGTLTLAEVAAPAIELAEEGFAVYNFLYQNLLAGAAGLARWESTAAIYLPDGQVPDVGTRLIQRDTGQLLRLLVEEERATAARGREGALRAARDRFYKGDIARQIAAFFQDQGGFLTYDDLASFSIEIDEAPPSVDYRGYQVYSCGPWCQGPVALETLKILEGYDLARYGQNSADALHLILEALKAAFADRERYYGDPNFIDVPLDGLLNAEYAAEWRSRISPERASPGMPEPGDPWRYQRSGVSATPYRPPVAFEAAVEPDTSYLCVVDREGNAFSATPSDGVTGTPIVPGLGIIISSRGVQSWLDADHPSAIAPGKRPRLTPSPGMILKDGKVFAPYGTPGNDTQPQAMVQLVVNLLDCGLDPQAAVEAPRVASYSFPRSSHPHPYTPGLTQAEARIPEGVLAELERRGHQLRRWPEWAAPAGSLCTIVVDHERGLLTGAADPRRLAYAMGW